VKTSVGIAFEPSGVKVTVTKNRKNGFQTIVRVRNEILRPNFVYSKLI
jgi:hypothetical protein